jgi:aryl-alcohol dehydrogenase-like predicted oxidoreductase
LLAGVTRSAFDAGQLSMKEQPAMEYRRLGTTGVKVSSLCLGAMMFGDWGTKDHDESIRVIHRALDAGINFIDTADVYSAGESEVIVGKALVGPRRDDVVLASKLHMPMGDDLNRRGNSRRWITRAVEDSLRRLGTDYLDLYQVHRYDPGTDLDDTLGALSDLVRSGKVRYAGHSTWPVSAIVAAQWTAQDRGRERFRTEQPPYSVLVRAIEADVLPTCARYGLGVLSYSPLASGWLSGRYQAGGEGPYSAARRRFANRFDLSVPENQRKLEAATRLSELADKAGITLIELAIAFVLRHPAVSSAIIGPRTMDHLESQLTAAEVTLSGDVLDQVDEIVPPGFTILPADNGWVSPALQASARRRP